MQTTPDKELWTNWCERPGLSEEERMRLDTVDTVLTAYTKEHPSRLDIDANINDWVFMPKTTIEIITELQPVMNLDHFDVIVWLRANDYSLAPDSTSGQLKWGMWDRRYIDD